MFLAYAIYFDHKRRTSPEFRKALKRESRKEARAAKEEADTQNAQQKEAIKFAIAEAREEGFPTDVEEREAYFMTEVARGETLASDGILESARMLTWNILTSHEGSDPVEAALCFYKALKVYPQPRDLMSIYDKTVTKPILDILADMIASDPTIHIELSSRQGSESGSHGIDD